MDGAEAPTGQECRLHYRDGRSEKRTTAETAVVMRNWELKWAQAGDGPMRNVKPRSKGAVNIRPPKRRARPLIAEFETHAHAGD